MARRRPSGKTRKACLPHGPDRSRKPPRGASPRAAAFRSPSGGRPRRRRRARPAGHRARRRRRQGRPLRPAHGAHLQTRSALPGGPPRPAAALHHPPQREPPQLLRARLPHWEHAASDGAADRRFADNRVVWPACTVRVGPLEIACHDPAATVRFVGLLRAKGAPVARRATSRSKRANAWCRTPATGRRSQPSRPSSSASSRTPPTSSSAPTSSARYAPSSRRPPTTAGTTSCSTATAMTLRARPRRVQMLRSPPHRLGQAPRPEARGAARVGAEKLIFVTSSGYTAGAYASEAGVELVDGARLCGCATGLSAPRRDPSPSTTSLAPRRTSPRTTAPTSCSGLHSFGPPPGQRPPSVRGPARRETCSAASGSSAMQV